MRLSGRGHDSVRNSIAGASSSSMITSTRRVSSADPHRAIATAMLRYMAPVDMVSRANTKRYAGWRPGDPATERFVENSPNAVLFAAIFDRGIATEVAWRGPRDLAKRLGHFDLKRIAETTPEKMAEYVGRFRGQPALHRYVGSISKAVVACADRLRVRLF